MKYNKGNPLKVCTLASGYDSQCLALSRLKEVFPDFDYELVLWAEYDPESPLPIDKQPAVIAHKGLFPQWADRNGGDLTHIQWGKVPDFDLLFSSTPCTDISAAGLVKGFEKGSRTRSSIIWNVHDCVRIKRPKYIVSENVANILSEKFWPTLRVWLLELERMGYENFMPPSFPMPWKGRSSKAGCLDTADYGIPQHRLRWFCVSILRTEDNPNPKYYFPRPMKLEKCLADVLDEDVDGGLWLSGDMLSRFCEKSLENESELGEGVEKENGMDYDDFLVSE